MYPGIVKQISLQDTQSSLVEFVSLADLSAETMFTKSPNYCVFVVLGLSLNEFVECGFVGCNMNCFRDCQISCSCYLNNFIDWILSQECFVLSGGGPVDFCKDIGDQKYNQGALTGTSCLHEYSVDTDDLLLQVI